MSTRTRSLAVFTALLALGAMPVPARTQAYPNRPITLVIPLPPGGTNDMMARAVADKLSTGLGQQVVIENRAAGGSGTVGTRQVAKSTPDGYTLLLGYTSTLATGPSMHRNVGYDPRKDFAPIGLIAVAPALLLVHPSVQVRNVSDLIAMMKAASPAFQVGTPGIGTVNHLASVLFAQQAGVDVQQIPYKGSSPALTDLIGGHVAIYFSSLPPAVALVKEGKVRALAVTSAKRSPIFPDLPTVAEVALPGYEAVLHYGIVAPAGTPRPIIDKLGAALRAAVTSDELRSRLADDGAEPLASTPEEYAADIDREETKWSAIVKTSGAKVD